MRLRTLAATVASVALFAGACNKSGSSGKKGDKSKEKSQKTAKASGDESGDEKKGKSGSSELPYEATGPVAVVNGTKLKASDYNELVKKQQGAMRRKLPHRLAKRFKTKTLDRLIETHLIEKEIDSAGISVTDKEVQKKFDKFKKRFPNDKAFQSFLKHRNTSKKEIKKQMKKDVALRKLLKQRKNIEVTEKEAKKHYEQNPKEFEQPEKVKASHILINAKKSASKKKVKKAKKRAEKIAKKAKKEGTDFSELAKKKSEGPSASKGGDLGYFSKERMVPKFSKKAFSMKNGEIAGPVRTRFGFHIIKRTGHKKAKKQSFEEAKSDIMEKLERKKLRKAMDSFVEGLKKEAKIKRMPENIQVNVEKKKGGGSPLGGLGGGGKNLKMKLKQLKKKAKQKAAGNKGGEKGGSGSDEGSAGQGK
ncbi:MAG: peptidylprolyl isomerase [Bradymonadaceae bacterium]